MPYQVQTVCSAGENHSCFLPATLVGLSVWFRFTSPWAPTSVEAYRSETSTWPASLSRLQLPSPDQRHTKPKINCAAATTRISPRQMHLEPSPTSKLVPGSRLPNTMPQLRWRKALLGHCAYPSLILPLPFLNPLLAERHQPANCWASEAFSVPALLPGVMLHNCTSKSSQCLTPSSHLLCYFFLPAGICSPPKTWYMNPLVSL